MRDPAFDPPQEKYEFPSLEDASKATPSIARYIEIKAANPDCLLFYRMGDFYELFFKDAEIAAEVLNIALTKRGKHLDMDISMCGVPYRRADEYLPKLIAAGYKVAVCEQKEDPAEVKKRGVKSVIHREVVRIVTAGTLTEDVVLDAKSANLLVAISAEKNAEGEAHYALASVDISTGFSSLFSVVEKDLAGELARLEPKELLLPDSIAEEKSISHLFRKTPFAVTRIAKDGMDSVSAQKRICSFFSLSTLDAFGNFKAAELSAFGAILFYLEQTQLANLPSLSLPRNIEEGEIMRIDAATRANLELTKTLSGERRGSLLSAIDFTITPGGGRLIAEWLASPLMNLPKICDRQNKIAYFVQNRALCETVRARLKSISDILRSISRILVDRGGPKDLRTIAQGLIEGECIARRIGAEIDGKNEQKSSLLQDESNYKEDYLLKIRETLLAAPIDLATDIINALCNPAPHQKRDGSFIQDGYDKNLDELRHLQHHSKQVIAQYQEKYSSETGIKQLKIKNNNVLGWFIEVPQMGGERLLQPPFSANFHHRQTMSGSMRFSTNELVGLEQKISEAAEKALALELEHFQRFINEIRAKDADIRDSADAIAQLDVICGLATLACQENWTKPILKEDYSFIIEGGRHPVVEQSLKTTGECFIANSCNLSPNERGDKGKIWLVTGANMAGKSTYLRQNALIAILSQMGSFVPAKSAEIGIVDRLFSRVGAADDLARGRSTFMVEMVETATILNQAGAKSLVILDEIGRGTATYDGLSIAWAAIEHLHDVNCCRSLFATHYHELTALTPRLPRLRPVTMKVVSHDGDVIFMHELIAGVADHSYGIHVAKLAGIPDIVIARARVILKELEEANNASPLMRRMEELPLFAAISTSEALLAKDSVDKSSHAKGSTTKKAKDNKKDDVLLRQIMDLNPDNMSPIDALKIIYNLQETARKITS